MRTEISLTISGGEGFEREALASEVVALLESLHIHVGVTELVVLTSDDEHADHVRHLAANAVVIIKRKP